MAFSNRYQPLTNNAIYWVNRRATLLIHRQRKSGPGYAGSYQIEFVRKKGPKTVESSGPSF